VFQIRNTILTLFLHCSFHTSHSLRSYFEGSSSALILSMILNACTYWCAFSRFLNQCDAVLVGSSHSYEGDSLVEIKSWLKTLRQDPLPVYPVGPLLPPGYGRNSKESSESEKNQVERDIEGFLTEMQSKYGEKSVIFVGFFICHLTNILDLHAPFSF